MNFIIITGLLLGLALLLRWFLHTSPRRVAQVLRYLSSVLLLAGGVALALRGVGSIGVPMALLGLSLLRAAWWPQGQAGNETPRHEASPQDMTPQQARRLLGVDEQASEEDILAAHRRLMKAVHPDAGGSQWLAQQLNLARDVLLQELRRRNGR